MECCWTDSMGVDRCALGVLLHPRLDNASSLWMRKAATFIYSLGFPISFCARVKKLVRVTH